MGVNKMQYQGPEGSREQTAMGRVVLCSAQDCRYNENTKCMAEAVHIILHSDHADCNTYTNNRHQAVAQMMEEEDM